MSKIYWVIIFILLVFLASYLFFSKKVIAPTLPLDNLNKQTVNNDVVDVNA
jgi:uncharacterized membrane protein YvbJ